MTAPYAIRRTLLAREDPRLDAIPMSAGLAVPGNFYTWEHLLGIRGFSEINRVVPGDTIAIAAETELAGDRFVCVVANDIRSPYDQRTYVVATRGGRVRAHVDLDAPEFCHDVFASFLRLRAASANPDDITPLDVANIEEKINSIFYARLTPFAGRLLLTLGGMTVLFDPESLAVVAACGAGAATVDTSSPVSCVAVENSPPGSHRLVRLGPDLDVLVRGDDALSLSYMSEDEPQVAGFIGFALTARGRVVAIFGNRYLNDWALGIFEPDLKEVHAEPLGVQGVELVGAGGLIFLRTIGSAETPEQGHWLLEVVESATSCTSGDGGSHIFESSPCRQTPGVVPGTTFEDRKLDTADPADVLSAEHK